MESSSGSANAKRKRVQIAAPTSLQAQRLSVGNEDFVLFSWNTSSKPPEGLLQSLSPAERDILARITGGASNEGIARARGVSVRTVANQVASIFRKLQVGSRLELVHRFAER